MDFIVKIKKNNDYFYLFNNKTIVYEPLLAKHFKRYDFAFRALKNSSFADCPYEIIEAPPYTSFNL